MNMKKLVTAALTASMLFTQIAGLGVYAAEQDNGGIQNGANEFFSEPAPTPGEPNPTPTATAEVSPPAPAESTEPTPPEGYFKITYIMSEGTLYEGAPKSYKAGEETILKEPTREGYAFSGWYMDTTTDGVPDTKISKISTEQIGDITLYAIWVKKYTINYELNDGQNPENAPLEFTSLMPAITLPTPTKTSFLFNGWYTDNNGDGIPETKITQIDTSCAKDVYITALWEATNKITYVLDGGTNYENAPTEFTKDSETIILGKPAKDGYVFTGWYVDNDNDSVPETKVDSIAKGTDKDITLYATWIPGYKIIYELNGGTNYEGAPDEFTADTETIVLKSPTKANADFLGWYRDTNGDGVGDERVTQIEKGTAYDVKLYALWNETYTITYVLNGGNLSVDAPKQYKSDSEDIILKKPVRQGYYFQGWYTDEHFTNRISTITKGSSGNLTLYATWRKNVGSGLGGAVYYLRFNTGEGTEIPDQLIHANFTATRPENPTLKGYTFSGWYTSQNYTEKFDFDSKITKNTVIYAKWVKIGEEYEELDGEFDTVLILTIGSKAAKVNGKTVQNDVAPLIKNDRTMMPIRFIAESLGADVEWDPDFRIVTVTLDKKQVVIRIDSDTAYINGIIYNLDSPAFISNDRTYIPVRFVSEALDCEVNWNEDAQNVYITK